LKSYQRKKTGGGCGKFLSLFGGMAIASCMITSPLMAADASVSGEATTIFRMKQTIFKDNQYPLYEYLRFNVVKNLESGSAVSFYLGTWGRVDTADKSTDAHRDGDLQYAYLSYQGAKNNTVVNLGRQFVTEGVAAERLDGLYLHSDFIAGIGAAAYAGKSVMSTDTPTKDSFLVYGGRLTQSMPQYYTVGLSALKSDTDSGGRFREEEGVDLWVHPVKQLDLTGRSSYNSITKGWMEHAYTASILPMESLRFSAELSNIQYKDYFYNMTSTVFTSNISNFINTDEKMMSLGGGVSYSPIKNLTIVGDYKANTYEHAGRANYYGGRVNYALPESFLVGCAYHRMDGKTDRLSYSEYRLFASKKLGPTDLAVDFNNTEYDTRINGIRNSYGVTGSAGYEFNEKLKIGADVEYSKNPDFDNEVRGLIKVNYLFDTKREKGGKHEK